MTSILTVKNSDSVNVTDSTLDDAKLMNRLDTIPDSLLKVYKMFFTGNGYSYEEGRNFIKMWAAIALADKSESALPIFAIRCEDSSKMDIAVSIASLISITYQDSGIFVELPKDDEEFYMNIPAFVNDKNHIFSFNCITPKHDFAKINWPSLIGLIEVGKIRTKGSEEEQLVEKRFRKQFIFVTNQIRFSKEMYKKSIILRLDNIRINSADIKSAIELVSTHREEIRAFFERFAAKDLYSAFNDVTSLQLHVQPSASQRYGNNGYNG